MRNLFFAFTTFCFGVAFASLFSAELFLPPNAGKMEGEYIRYSNKNCAPLMQTDVKACYHSERESSLVDRIRETELKLVELKTRSKILKPSIEKKMSALQLRLEAELQTHLIELNKILDQKKFAELPRRTDGAKVIHPRVCYEN
ncbi:MAG: hypothetical protein H0U23_10385 [Blastocatellia bacterium]|nr:hypothetical protein [Blastocatellia bacterium]